MAMNLGQSSGGGGGRRRRSRGAPMAEINVTPLVDVMLVLLIIFMVTAPMLTAGVPIDLPDSKAEALQEKKNEITVSMDGQGRLFLDDQELAPGELADRLAAVQRPNGEAPLVTLRADKALDYGRVIAVMGELNAAGFKQISLVSNGVGGGGEPAAPAPAAPAAAAPAQGQP
ncbi:MULTISPECIES: protein TolR [Novosphingobium]|uniref:protein TolR n=1 Tax=Novosphingobium TaxID=165696 RepID=UPI0006B953CC|nr:MULTISPECIES: protein TolR [Novosphingobium]PTR12396.1 cell division and transport-associated protein TolR [Novosphingobium sp. GV055]PUB05797.1 cell division and transport-associated protein TolR [Novosphingobium sp. GV061]PUB22030.1 cell division and transport-associated protein TolR [Novosphingobium sp. GV079]PUB43803.1 cell division and transport-associated protein TolR [Novosphingobium sp. GV027]WQD94304.1 protein TolR [Novosphingobium capsulatum]